MTTLLVPRSWLRLFLTIHLVVATGAIFTGCTSTESNDNEGTSATRAASDEEALDEDLDTQAQSQASNDDLSDELALEELGEPAAPSTQPPANDLSIQEPKAAEPAVVEPQAPAGKFTGNFSEVSITDIRYLAKKSGGTVVVETSAPATYHTREMPEQSQVVIEVANAHLPDKLKRPYVTKDFGQEITSIVAYQDKGSSTVRVVVQFRTPMHANINQDGRTLLLTGGGVFEDVQDNPTLGAQDSGPGPTKKAIDADDEELVESVAARGSARALGGSNRGANPEATDSRILPSSSLDNFDSENLKFYGKPISIEVRDTSVREVINLIADQSGANIVLAGDVEGTVSLKLRQIPWDQALLIVMKARNLGYVRQGSILRVAPYESLQRESEATRRVADAQKAAEPLRVKIIPVGYAKVDLLKDQIEPFLSLGRGRVVGDMRTNSLIVTDIPDVLDRIANLVKALDLPPLQVLIEGKVVEARENFIRDFGIRWGFSGQGVTMGGGRSFTPDFRTNMSIPQTGGVANFRIGQFDIFGDITATLGLAETEDLVHIVSSPRVVAVNNEAATIIQGTNIPVSQTNLVNGTTVTTVNYMPIEMRLDVTPQVTSENDIVMQIQIKREFAGARATGQVPDINRREAKTKVLVRNGETAVVGGVYQSDSNEIETGIPFLRSIPVVGWLFKSKTKTSDKTELLVFLTPRILNAETSLQKENTL